MQLYSQDKKCISSCTTDKGNEPVVRRRNEEISLLPALQFPLKIRLNLIYARILLLVVLAISSIAWPKYYAFIFWLQLLLDVAARYVLSDLFLNIEFLTRYKP